MACGCARVGPGPLFGPDVAQGNSEIPIELQNLLLPFVFLQETGRAAKARFRAGHAKRAKASGQPHVGALDVPADAKSRRGAQEQCVGRRFRGPVDTGVSERLAEFEGAVAALGAALPLDQDGPSL